MKKEYESPELAIEYFVVSSICTGSGVGWEEEEEFDWIEDDGEETI